MNDASGNTVTELVAGANGTASGASVTNKGKIGNARDFGSVSNKGYIKLPSSVGGVVAKPHTIAFWIYPTDVTKANQVLFATSGGSSQAGNYIMMNGAGASGGAIHTHLTNGAGGYCLEGNSSTKTKTPLVNGKWQHVAFAFTGGTYSYYINGKLDKTGSGGACGGNIKTKPVVGMHINEKDQAFAGRLDELAMWSRALSAKEVALVYGGGDGVAPQK